MSSNPNTATQAPAVMPPPHPDVFKTWVLELQRQCGMGNTQIYWINYSYDGSYDLQNEDEIKPFFRQFVDIHQTRPQYVVSPVDAYSLLLRMGEISITVVSAIPPLPAVVSQVRKYGEYAGAHPATIEFALAAVRKCHVWRKTDEFIRGLWKHIARFYTSTMGPCGTDTNYTVIWASLLVFADKIATYEPPRA